MKPPSVEAPGSDSLSFLKITSSREAMSTVETFLIAMLIIFTMPYLVLAIG
jgi:hypothetical protein